MNTHFPHDPEWAPLLSDTATIFFHFYTTAGIQTCAPRMLGKASPWEQCFRGQPRPVLHPKRRHRFHLSLFRRLRYQSAQTSRSPSLLCPWRSSRANSSIGYVGLVFRRGPEEETTDSS
uniref:Uncharacterized protein n=1 Tax=Cacopsylla melanoneura TaxID=428564 RepID=A0A8D9DNW8_9HEMI